MAGSSKDKENAETPIVEDRWIGAVAGNKLDAFNNASYNFRLYMIPDDDGEGGGYKNGALKAKPEQTVIIAQTSVTGVAIENIELNIVRSGAGVFVTNGAFTLIQPGAADLLDQIQMAKQVLGIKAGMFANAPVFLELNFKGYTEDLDDNEAAGDPVTIDGPWCWQLELMTIDVNINDTGSTYDCTFVQTNSNAYADTYYTIPADTSMTGSTIVECLEDLQTTLKKFRTDNYKEHAVQDEVEFDFSNLVLMLGGDGNINYSNFRQAEQVNRLMNADAMGIKTREEYDKILEDNPDSLDGGIEASGGVWRRNRVQVKQGTNFHKILTTLLVMNDDFLKQITRKHDFEDPVIDEDGLDMNQTFTTWYRIEAATEWLDYDHRRNTYAKRVVYKPVLYETADESLSSGPGEFNTTKENITTRINEMKIRKAYHYLYTGQNDQILEATIGYKAGQLLLGAPQGGLMGDASTNPNAPGTPTSDGDNNNKQKKAEIAKAQEDTDALAKQLNNAAYQNEVADKLNLSESERKSLQDNKQARKNLAEAMVLLNNGGNDPLGYFRSQASNTDPSTPTSSDPNPNETNPPYKPEPSGYLYGADLIDNAGGSEIVIGELSSRQAMNTLKTSVTKPSFDYSKSITSTSGNTVDGTPKATLFGYMYQNVNDASILIDLGLKIRGDVWYLGEKPVDPHKGKGMTAQLDNIGKATTMDSISYNGNDNYFLFTMQTPRVIDPDMDDEDNNTGYLEKAGTAYFISGVYQIMATTCTFNNGMFEIEVNAKKNTALNLSEYDIVDIDYGVDDGDAPLTDAEILALTEETNARQLAEFNADRGDG